MVEMSIHKVGISWASSGPVPAGHFVLLKSKDGEGPLCIFIGLLHADPETLEGAAMKHGYPCEIAYEDSSGDYLARLTGK